MKMENENETKILLNMYTNITECKTSFLQNIYESIFVFLLAG